MSAAAALARLQPLKGQTLGYSRWIAVDQSMIDSFASVTHDDQWIHVDAKRAERETPFGGTIAHGFLTLSLASRFAYDVIPVEDGQTMGINYGFDRLRFLSPVRPGQAVRGLFVLSDAELRKPRELARNHKLTIEIRGQETPALAADWLSLAIFAAD